MADSAANFTQGAAAKIVKAAKMVLGKATDQTGSPSHKRSFYSTGFWAQIGGYSGTFGYILNYEWQEMQEVATIGSPASSTMTVKSGGRSGTTSVNPAYNQYEVNGGQPTQPIASGTIVWMEYTFDINGNPYYRFNLLQLPGLSQYQGWYGTSVSSVVAVTADYVRAS